MKGGAFCSESEVGVIDRTRTMEVSSNMAGHVRKLMKIREAGLLYGSFTQILKTTKGWRRRNGKEATGEELRRADMVAHTCNPNILALRRLRQEITVKVKPAWDA